MSHNEISPNVVSTTHETVGRDASRRASLAARVIARVRSGAFDRMLAVGVPAAEGSALAVHEARLTSTAEREAIARSLRQAAYDAEHGNPLLSARVPLHRDNIAAAADLIDAITLRLHSPRPVGARGMARLRQIMSDGSGPMYRYGRGDLHGRLGAALAEL